MSRVFSFTVLAAALLLSACGVGTVSYVNVDSSYDPVQYARLPYTGPLYVEVSGNPFAIPGDQLAQIVYSSIAPSDAVVGNGQGPRLHFAFGPDASNFNLACSAAGTSRACTRSGGSGGRNDAARRHDLLSGGEPADDLRRRVALEAGDDGDRALDAVLQHLDRRSRTATGDCGVRDVEHVVALTGRHGRIR